MDPIIKNFRNVYVPEGPPTTLIGAEDNPPTCTMTYSEIYPNRTSTHHSHPWEHEIFIIKGSGTLVCDGVEHTIRSGDAIYIPPHSDHYTLNNGGQGVIRRIEVNPLSALQSETQPEIAEDKINQPPIIKNLDTVDQTSGPARTIIGTDDGVEIYTLSFRGLLKDECSPKHVHSGEHLAFFLEGTAILECDGQDFFVAEGDAILVSGDTTHEWRSNSDNSAKWLVFNPVQ